MTSPQTYALSLQQSRTWTASSEPAARRHLVAVELPATCDSASLASALTDASACHEILRTTFSQPTGLRVGVQLVHDELPTSFTEVDAGTDLDVLCIAEMQRPWDIEHDAPVRLARCGDTLVVTALALALDLPSVTRFANEILARAAGAWSSDDEPLQYADFVAWQTELHEDPATEAARAHWTARRSEYTPRLPFDTAVLNADAPATSVRIDTADADAGLRTIADRYAVSWSTVVHAAFAAFVQRLSDEPTVALASWRGIDGQDDFTDALGAFGNWAPTTSDFDADPTVAQVIDALNRTARGDAAYNDALIAGEDDACTETPLDIGVISVQDAPRLHRVVTDLRDRAVVLVCASDSAHLVFDSARFDADTRDRFGRQFGALLASVAANPEAPTSTLALIDAAERELVVSTWNQTSVALPSATVVASFEAAVRANPGREAVGAGDTQLTYAELDARASALARALVEAGVNPDDAVGLCTDRSVHVLVAVLGIWKAGAAYVPLNPDHPVSRIEHQLAETGASIVVTVGDLRSALPENTRLVLVDDHAVTSADGATFDNRATLDGRAYVMYTSGSTGLPKGVEVSHANLANYSHALAARIGLTESATPMRCATVTAISTDLGNTAIFPTLVAGGCVEIITAEVAMDPNLFAQQCERRPLDVLKVTPSHLTALLTAGAERVLPAHTLLVGGEASSWDLVATVQAAHRCRVLNHYGPTETTIGSCTYDVPASVPTSRPATVPVGRPIANTQCYVVDASGTPQPVGVPGELWIGGAGVAVGYCGQPEQTADRFVTNPFAPGRVYRTGDKARWLPSGDIEFLGRVDDQVKIRGFRIEPREIEQVVATHPQVRSVAVIAREDVPGDRRLVAYVVADGNPTIESLRDVVSAALPDYMAPSAYLLIGALPLTPSGKLDRRALPAPTADAADLGRPFVEPSTETERLLAECWAEVLHRERIGVHDDFFELGGHSLLAAQVVARVRNTFGVELPLHSLFTAPTITLLAVEVDALAGGAIDDAELDELLAGLSPEEIEALLNES